LIFATRGWFAELFCDTRFNFTVHSMKTEVILTQPIVGLGAESDQVTVAAGFARNFLFPQRLAIPVTQANKRRLEALRQRRAEREAHEFNTMTELAKALTKLICVIKVKAGEDGKMFGAVTSGMIADELKHQFDISLDKRKIHLEHPIKTLGEHEVALHLHPEVKGSLKIRVESLTPVTAPAETAAPAEAKTDKPKTEKGSSAKHETETGKTKKAEADAAKKSRPAKSGKSPKAAKTPPPEKAG